MRKLRNKKSIVALCVIVPIATVLAFVPKIMAKKKANTYTTTSI